MMMSATQMLALVVEDDPSTREFLVRALTKVGIDTLEAASVGEALVRMEQEPLPTAVVLDLMLPDASGTILLRRIKRDALPVRVAVVTGVKDPYSLWDVLRFPPDKLFKKPLNLTELINWLQQQPLP
jgi:DNA-binding response OmpR family regulator